MKIVDIKRSEAAAIIEYVRSALMSRRPHEEIEESLLLSHGIEPLKACDSENHAIPYIDNCPVCMPRWNVCGPLVKVRL